MMQHRLVFLGIPILMVIAACTSTDSTYIDTAGMYANFEAEAVGDGTTDVRGSLRQNGVHSTSFIDLEGGDLLRAVRVSNSDEEVMRENQIFGATWYTANFPTDAKDTAFRIEYERVEKVSAMNSVASMPVPFNLMWTAAPTADPPQNDCASSFNPTAGCYIIWVDVNESRYVPDFDVGDELSYRITGSCIQATQGSIAWDGNPAKDSLELSGQILTRVNNEQCDITVEITLARDSGTVDGAFADGIYVTKQTRTKNLTLLAEP